MKNVASQKRKQHFLAKTHNNCQSLKKNRGRCSCLFPYKLHKVYWRLINILEKSKYAYMPSIRDPYNLFIMFVAKLELIPAENKDKEYTLGKTPNYRRDNPEMINHSYLHLWAQVG